MVFYFQQKGILEGQPEYINYFLNVNASSQINKCFSWIKNSFKWFYLDKLCYLWFLILSRHAISLTNAGKVLILREFFCRGSVFTFFTSKKTEKAKKNLKRHKNVKKTLERNKKKSQTREIKKNWNLEVKVENWRLKVES